MKLKHIQLLIITVAFCVLGTMVYYGINRKNHAPTIESSHKALQTIYQEKLTNHEQQIWHQITQKTGILLEDAKKERRIINEHKKNAIKTIDTSISKENRELIQNTLLEFGINPKTIQLKAYGNKDSALSADDYIIYIHEPTFNAFSIDAKKFVIAHEIQHILNQDTSMDGALWRLLGHTRKAIQPEIDALSRFTELRADVGALLHNPEYLEGGIIFFKTLLEDDGDPATISHPKNSQRLSVAQNMKAKLYNQPYTPVIIS